MRTPENEGSRVQLSKLEGNRLAAYRTKSESDRVEVEETGRVFPVASIDGEYDASCASYSSKRSVDEVHLGGIERFQSISVILL